MTGMLKSGILFLAFAGKTELGKVSELPLSMSVSPPKRLMSS